MWLKIGLLGFKMAVIGYVFSRAVASGDLLDLTARHYGPLPGAELTSHDLG
jgi:hypothetical protein